MSLVNPETFLDVGCGFGKFGFLAREYLGLWNSPEKTKHKIRRVDAIEAWEPYIGDFQRLIYDKIMIGDIRDLCESIPKYDMILMAEVLEHLNKEDGIRVIKALSEKASKCFTITTPVKVELQGEEHGNVFEVHRSQWSVREFEELGCSEVSFNDEVRHFIVHWYGNGEGLWKK
jgi:cyclopropane fatty-acyl-phospholipid synthase-like methyltransferase